VRQPFRLSCGGRIDRATTLGFEVDGHSYSGHSGETLASAMLANGVHLAGRSFKYHRPRGILSAGSEEPNALFAIHRGGGRCDPNTRATQVALFNGLRATSQNCWPSLALDMGALNGSLSRLIPAGFYYKTFMWPGWAWRKLYEPLIRAAAGLGRAPAEPDPDDYTNRYATCDVLVVGAGPAGLAAALAAAESGARVIVCDEQEEFGGSLLSEPKGQIDRQPAWTWLAGVVAELADRPNVRMLPRTTAFGYYAQNFLALLERVTDHLAAPPARMPRQRIWQVRAKQVVLATGAIERPLVFADNDRPGIMLAGAVQTYVNRYAVLPGRRVVVVATHASGYRAAFDLQDAGSRVSAIVDPRRIASDVVVEAQSRSIEILQGHVVTRTSGRLRVSAVRVAELDNDGRISTRDRVITCDLVLMAGGFTPSVHLFSQSRGRLRWDESIGAFVPGQAVQAQCSVGACAGAFSLAASLHDGFAAGAAASGDAGASRGGARKAPTSGETRRDIAAPAGELPSNRDAATLTAFVDFQNDVTTNDIRLAVREGFRSIEHIKRYTTTGMATDQGRTSNLNGLAIAAEALGKTIPETGLTTFRPPYTPVTFGALAGARRKQLFDPVRVTSTHAWAQAHGAVFENVALWKRARYFPRDGEDMHAAVDRECRQTRGAVGIFDASTLGKIEIVGPDAVEFMNRMYVNSWSKLEVGNCRYGVMLREDGFIFDDGVAGRLAADRFHVTTTTGGAARVLHVMEDYLQTEFRDLTVWLTSTTEQWSVIAVNGPRARDVLMPLVEGLDISKESLPHMSVREGVICGVPMRLFRVSFTGELGFEVNVPSGYGHSIWEMIHESGRRFDVVPYGTEAMHVMRAEKGYIIVGQETDGTVTPIDAGLDWAIGKAKADFVGKRSLSRPDMLRPDRKQLVGLRSKDRRTVLEEGAQIAADRPVSKALGHVTSAYWSAAAGEPIALALIASGRKRMGEILIVPMPDRRIEVEVVAPVFYDRKGERLNA
jgi:sarcosine oxidase, subunit alpha